VRASTELVVALDAAGRSRLAHASCEVPLLFRVADHDDPELRLSWVNGAAGPLGGDRLRLSLRIEPGASVVVRSTGAALVQPGPHGGCSAFDVRIELGERSCLDWCPEPTVSVRASRHRTTTHVRAAPTAVARLVEHVVLGRHAEPGGRLALHQRVEVGERVVLDHELELGDGVLAGPGAHGGGRAFVSAVLLGERWRPEVRAEVKPRTAAAAFELSDDAWLVSGTADDLRDLSAFVPS
jgi:urease accessory protein